jgi:hypothetical protein
LIADLAEFFGVKSDRVKTPRMLFAEIPSIGAIDPAQNRAAVSRAAGWAYSSASQVLSGSRRLSPALLLSYARGVSEVYGPAAVPGAVAGLLINRWEWIQEQPAKDAVHIRNLASACAPSIKELASSAETVPSADLVEDPSVEELRGH